MILKADKITKTFINGTTTFKAVDNVNFEINAKQFVSITGKSGSGKSTLLYLLGLLDSQTSGEIIFENSNTSSLSDNQKRILRLNKIGYVFQDYSLMPSLTAKQNVMLPLFMQGYTNAKANELAIKTLNEVGLGERVNSYPSKLSGGEKQRVGIARAVAKNPILLIADEPTANLDSKTSKEIMDLFMHLNKKGQSIIMVTHEQDYAKMASTVYKMQDGKFI